MSEYIKTKYGYVTLAEFEECEKLTKEFDAESLERAVRRSVYVIFNTK